MPDIVDGFYASPKVRTGREERATIDFETRSTCMIQRAGSWIYARHPSTLILCLAWMLPGQKTPSIWHAGYGDTPPSESGETTLQDLFDYIRSGGLVEAHNSFFERVIWHHIATRPLEYVRDDKDGDAYIGARGMGAPPVADCQWRCSAAKAGALAFPRGLGDACAAAAVEVQKDEGGRQVMLELTKPRRLRKADPHRDHNYFLHDPDKHQRLHSYCQRDVAAEHALSEFLPELSPFELRVWQADQRANWRGVAIDRELVEAAIDLDAKVKTKLNRELYTLTGIPSGTKRVDILAWLRDHEVKIDDTSAPTLDWAMRQKWYAKLDPDTQRVVRIARDSNRTSVAKYHRIRDMLDPDDGRVRDLVRYHGAATGRWSGSGIQVQNFPRGNLEELTGVKGYSIDRAVEDVKTRDLKWCEAVYGDVLALLSSVTRGALIAGPGKVFYVADYSAIEARVVLWLAGAERALDVFRRGDDIYCDMATGIYGRPITKSHRAERQLGKVTILGLGYGMGFLTFLLTLRSYNMRFTPEEVRDIIGARTAEYEEWVSRYLRPSAAHFTSDGRLNTRKLKFAIQRAKKAHSRLRMARENPDEVQHELALCKYLVDMYRARYPEVVSLWGDYETSSLQAVIDWEKWEDGEGPKPEPIRVGMVRWIVEDRYLRCYLPSGRFLTYADPFTIEVKTPWGATRREVRFWAVGKKSKKWSETGSYGGAWVENIDQATARDIMAWAFLATDESDTYIPITTIHDELLAEADEGTGSVEEFEQLLVTLPPAFDGCPIAAEGGSFQRYRK